MKITKIHWWLPKVLCLIIAGAFWLYVMNEQNPIMSSTFTVPVEVRNLDRSLVALNVPKTVKVHVSMSRNGLMQLRSDNIKAYVDLQNVTDGDYPNTKILVSVPGDGEAVEVTPAYFDLKVDTYAVKSVPVTVSFFGDMHPGFKAKLSSTTPGSITIAGSASRVGSVDRAVASVNLAGKNESFTEYDSVSVLDASGNTVTGIDVMPTQVKVSINVTEDTKTVNIPLTAKAKGEPAPGYSVGGLSINPSTVTVTAPGSILDHLKSINLGEVDIDGATGDITQRLPIPLPSGASSIPTSASVEIAVERNSRN